MGKDWQLKDITGQKFEKLTVINRIGSNKIRQATWLCQCECGNKIIVTGIDLRRGKVKSCGCIRRENLLKKITKHNKSKSKLYKVFIGIKGRCYNKNNYQYKNYGGRGIEVCREWLEDFINFDNWAMANGYREGLSIDRIDNNGNYCPENCRFVDNTIQQRNKRNNKYLAYNGENLCIADWEKKLNFSQGAIKTRIKCGWTVEQIIETPSNKTRNSKVTL